MPSKHTQLIVKKTQKKKNSALDKIAHLLENKYGIPPRSFKKRYNPLNELIFTILSQNTTDINRDRAYAELTRKYSTPDKILAAGANRIGNAIRTAGLASQKSKRIIEILKILKKEHGNLNLDFICSMDKEDAKKYLGRFNGVGPKTINCVLLFSCGKEAFPVDTHIKRISKRLGMIAEKMNDEEIHRIMGEIVPQGKAYSLHINLIRHGRKICKPFNPLCNVCCIKKFCSFYEKQKLKDN